MTIEGALLISGISAAAAIYFGLTAKRRNDKKDTQAETSAFTTVAVRLEDIKDGMKEVKAGLIDVKDDLREIRERLVATEESTKQAHKRLDRFEQLAK